MHVSLDGFVAGPKGEMDWIKVDEELFDVGAVFIEKADAGMYGRVTFEMMEGYWPTAAQKPNATKHDKHHSKWYNNVHKIVLSTTLKESELKNTEVISSNIREKINAIKNQPGGDIVMFGSPTAAHSMMAENLFTHYRLFINPVLIGKGIPLFKDVQSKTILKLLDKKELKSGVVGLHYKVGS